MLKRDVHIGARYRVRLNGTFRTIRIDSVSSLGGWNATNLDTGRTTWIKSAAKLRFEENDSMADRLAEDIAKALGI